MHPSDCEIVALTARKYHFRLIRVHSMFVFDEAEGHFTPMRVGYVRAIIHP